MKPKSTPPLLGLNIAKQVQRLVKVSKSCSKDLLTERFKGEMIVAGLGHIRWSNNSKMKRAVRVDDHLFLVGQ